MSQDLTNGDIKSQIKNIGIPASVGFFFYTVFNITDTYFAGTLGTSQIASLSLSGVVFFMLISLASGMSRSTTALVGNAIGAKDHHLIQDIIVNSYYLALILCAIISLVAFNYVEYIFAFINAKGDYLNYAIKYIHVIMYGILFYIISFFSNAVLISYGDSKSFRNILIFNSFLNIILSYWFITGGFGIDPMGVSGIALATIIIEFFASSYLLFKVYKIDAVKKITSYTFKPSIIFELLKQGTPTTINNLLMSSGAFILMYFISQSGEDIVAAYGIGIRIEQIALLPGIGLSVAIAALVSQNNGAKNYERIREIMKETYTMAFYIYIVGFLFMFVLASHLASFFTDNLDIIEETSLYIKINALLLYAYILIFINVAFLQAIKRPTMIFYIGLARQVILPIAFYSIVWYYQMDAYAYWLATFLSVTLSTFYIHYLQKIYLREKLNENIS
jgi:putative MATE family efflux protein